MKRITKKAWFGKKIIGWGYCPVSLEGWLITIVFLVVFIANYIYNQETTTGHAILAVIVVIFLLIVRLTGDTPGSKVLDKLRNKK